MTNPRFLPLLLGLFALLAGLPALAEQKPLRFGVFAYLGEERTRERYEPLADYLNLMLLQGVELEVLGKDDITRRIEEGSIDIVTTNPTHFLVARKRYPLTGVIATLVEQGDDMPLHMLGGVIIAAAERTDLNGLQDIRGKVVATPSFEHMGGFRAQAFELYQAGIELPRDVERVDEVITHQEVVKAILAGKADIGFVRNGIIERMVRQGELEPGRVKIINPQDHPGFPHLASTRLYPEWPVFALPHVDERSIRQVAAALFALEANHPAARAMGMNGYTIPADYLAVEELARVLRLPPFDTPPDITLADIASRYKLWIAVLGAMAFSGSVFTWVLLVVNRRLVRSRHKATEAAERIAAIIWGTDAGTWEWNVRTGECVFNDRWASIIGRSLDELQPIDIRTWTSLAHPDDLERSQQALDDHFAGRTEYYECEARMRHKDGRWVWVLDRGKVVEWAGDGKPLRMSGTHQDITARKEAEEDARRLSTRLSMILDAASEGIYGVDTEGRTIFVNRAACNMLGWTAEDILGHHQHNLIHHTRADGTPYPLEDCPIFKSRQDGRVREVSNEVFWRADGSSLPVEYVSSPVLNEVGEVIGGVVVFRNVSQRTRLMADLARSNMELEEFAYAVSHDLRQPLRMINSFTTLLERKLTGSLDDEGRQYMGFVRDGARRMEQMLVSLLEYSRVGSASSVDMIPTREVLAEAMRYLGPAIDECGAEVAIHGDWPEIRGSRDELVRLLQNLLGNAIKYRRSDGLCQIQVSGSLGREQWMLKVADNGIGFPPAQTDQLFKVFQRLHPRGKQEGTGVGLALCRRIVEHHGGTIVGVSEGDDQGAIFTVTLPLNGPVQS